MVDWRNSVTGALLARLAARPRPLELRLRLILGVDGGHLAVLDLDGRHRLGHVLTALVELDRTEERGRVEVRQRVTRLLRIRRAGLLDGQHEREAGGRGLGAVVLGRLAEALLVVARVVGRRSEDRVLDSYRKEPRNA